MNVVSSTISSTTTNRYVSHSEKKKEFCFLSAMYIPIILTVWVVARLVCFDFKQVIIIRTGHFVRQKKSFEDINSIT